MVTTFSLPFPCLTDVLFSSTSFLIYLLQRKRILQRSKHIAVYFKQVFFEVELISLCANYFVLSEVALKIDTDKS